MAAMKEIVCACGCGRKKLVRVADVARGWGKYYSKSCKAKHQERRTGQCASYLARRFSGDVVYDNDGTFSNAHLFSNEGYDYF